MSRNHQKKPAKIVGKKGLLIIYEGEGKGKTTAVMGLAVRAIGTGLNVFIGQFIKGEWPSGERDFFEAFKSVRGSYRGEKKLGVIDVVASGKGFIKILNDRKPFSEHEAAAREALEIGRQAMLSGKYDVIILDEAISAVETKVLKTSDLLRLIKDKPANVHLVMTGHYAPKSIVAKADLVSRVDMVKHPYYKGILAQRGIDY